MAIQSKSPSLTGSLSETSLSDLCQVLGQRTGVLKISEHGRQGAVYFNQGKVVHAELENLYGRDAFLDLALWKAADFEFITGPMPQYVTIEEPLTGMIMDAAVYQDIWQDLIGKAIHDKSILVKKNSGGQSDAIMTLSEFNQKVLDSFLQPTPLDQVTSEFVITGCAKKDVISAVHDLVLAGYLAPSRPVHGSSPNLPSVSGSVRSHPTPVPIKAKTPNANKSLLMIGTALLLFGVGLLITFGLFKNKKESSSTSTAPAPVQVTSAQPSPSESISIDHSPPSSQKSSAMPPPVSSVEQIPKNIDPAVEAPASSVGIVSSSDAPSSLPPGSLDALDTDAILAFEGKETSVAGKIVRTHRIEKSGITFLDFRDRPKQGFVLVIFKNSLDRFSQDPLEFYRGKNVKVTGKISIYDGLPQIIVNHPSMIEVLD